MQPKVFRDPVHNAITLKRDDAGDRLLLALIDSREVQRLRRIRQLGLANLVFHGAEHSRFAHSLGAMHVARVLLDQLGSQTPLGPADRLPVLAAALLHDIGHGPLSHTVEGLLGAPHEEWTRRLLADPETEVHRLLAGYDPALPGVVGELVSGTHRWRALGSIVSGQLDCDRLDYILRDGWALGVAVTYDLTRLVSMLSIDRIEDRLVIDGRGHDAVESYLIARHHLYRNVYHHRTIRAAGAMLAAACRRAAWLAGQQRLSMAGLAPGLSKALRGLRPSAAELLDLDDGELWAALKAWRDGGDAILQRLAGGLLDRRLYKSVQASGLSPEEQSAALGKAYDLLCSAGYDPDYHLLCDTARDQAYRPYAAQELGTEGIFVRWPDGNREISETSRLVRSLAEASSDTRWFVPAELRPEVKKILGARA